MSQRYLFLWWAKIVLIPTKMVVIATNIRSRIAQGNICMRQYPSSALPSGVVPWLSSEYHPVTGIAASAVKQPSLYETSQMKWRPVIPEQWMWQQYHTCSLSKRKGFLNSWPWTRPPSPLGGGMALAMTSLPGRQVSLPCFSRTSRSTLCNTALMLCDTADLWTVFWSSVFQFQWGFWLKAVSLLWHTLPHQNTY